MAHRHKPFVFCLYCLYFAIVFIVFIVFILFLFCIFLGGEKYFRTKVYHHASRVYPMSWYSKAKKWSLLIFEIQFPMLLFLRTTRNEKVVTKNKMDNPRFFDEETILLVHQNEDFDNYNILNIGRIDETSFTEPDATKATSTLQLRQKVKRDKNTTLYRHLNVTGDPGLADIDRFMIKKIQEQATLTCFFSMVISISNPLLINVLVSF